MAKITQKQVWNEIAEPWKKFREKPIKEVKEFVYATSGRLLDLGCGSGRHFFSKDGLTIYGADFSEKMIELAKKMSEIGKLNIELKIMDKEEIPYPEEFFDSVICIAVLHCVETKEKREKLLKEIKRVLKVDGKILIRVWSKNHKKTKNKEKESFIPWKTNNKKFDRYYYFYEKKELKEEMEKAGFKILEVVEKDNIQIIGKKLDK